LGPITGNIKVFDPFGQSLAVPNQVPAHLVHSSPGQFGGTGIDIRPGSQNPFALAPQSPALYTGDIFGAGAGGSHLTGSLAGNHSNSLSIAVPGGGFGPTNFGGQFGTTGNPSGSFGAPGPFGGTGGQFGGTGGSFGSAPTPSGGQFGGQFGGQAGTGQFGAGIGGGTGNPFAVGGSTASPFGSGLGGTSGTVNPFANPSYGASPFGNPQVGGGATSGGNQFAVGGGAGGAFNPNTFGKPSTQFNTGAPFGGQSNPNPLFNFN